MVIGTYISIITLNVNGLNAPTTRHRLAKGTHKNKIHIYAVYKRPTSDLGIHKVENERMEKDIPCKWKSKENWVSNTHIKKIGFKIKTITRDKEGHYIMIKVSI